MIANVQREPWSNAAMSIRSTGLSDWENGPAPLTVTFQTAKKLSGLGLTKLWDLAKQRRLELVYVDGRTLICFASLRALLTPRAASDPQSLHPRRGRPRKANQS
jgi:hypothetical protein